MKTYKYLYQKTLDETVIRKAYAKLRKGKTKRKEIQYIDQHLDEEVEKMRIMLLNTKPIEVEHPELAFNPKKHKPTYILEHGKERELYKPYIIEQWVHHIIIFVLEPIIVSTSYKYSCGSYSKRGTHYGRKLIIEMLKNSKQTYAIAKCDIRHFYKHITHKVLYRELTSIIADDWFIYLIKVCLKHFRKGLPLGFYISPGLSNYLLEPVDRMISAIYPNYVRYVDDMIFFGNNTKVMSYVIKEIQHMLKHRFYLKLKGNYQISKFIRYKSGRPLDFMGFVFYRNKVIMRKFILLKATALARKIHKAVIKGYRIYRKWISGCISYMGWFKYTDSYECYLKRIKPYISIGLLKKIISNMDRRLNNDRMEKNKLFTKTRSHYENRLWSFAAS